jgi:hypothetical protein
MLEVDYLIYSDTGLFELFLDEGTVIVNFLL